MNVVLPIPDEIARRLGDDIERQALEGLALESVRVGRLTKAELRGLLGIPSRYALDGFLKAHEVYDPITIEETERQVRDVKSLGV